MRISFLLLIPLLFITGVHGFQITEVYPDTYLNGDADEYLVISGQGSLDILSVNDGEGSLSFPPGSVSSGTVTIARDSEAFSTVNSRFPDYEIIGKNPTVPDLIHTGRFQLGNQKDDLALLMDGTKIQNISWPGSFKPRKGQVHYLNSTGFWDERILMSGGSRFTPSAFPNASGMVFVSPDCSRAVFEHAISSAVRSILVNIYEFTDPELANLLCQAANRGVRVQVLIEGGPVGGMTADEKAVISILQKEGISIQAMEGDGEDHAPYRFNHAKYLVIDDSQVLLTTENFTPHSLPVAGLSGNRGWGVMVTSPEFATYLSRVFEFDISGPGVIPISGIPSDVVPYSGPSYNPVFQPVQFRDATITPVLAPDTSNLIIPFMESAKKRLLIEEAYIKHWSDGRKNPYLETAIQIARKGVHVRILLDSYYYNVEGDNDNDEIASQINQIAKEEQIPLEAKLIDLDKLGLLKLHAKGVIVDDAVFISSINWNENSPLYNREAGLIISDQTSADYFASVFEQDWKGEKTQSTLDNHDPDLKKISTIVGVVILLIILYWWRHRR